MRGDRYSNDTPPERRDGHVRREDDRFFLGEIAQKLVNQEQADERIEQAILRIEAAMHKRLSRLESRVDSLEQDRDKLGARLGILTLLLPPLGAVFAKILDWVQWPWTK